MVPKFSYAKKNHLIIIQFLDEGEPKTGYTLAKDVAQSSPHIGKVDFFESGNKDEIIDFINNKITLLVSNEEEIVLYLDSHGFPSYNGIGHKNGFISWDELAKNIKNSFKNQRTSLIIITSACNGISFKNEMDKQLAPICQKLIAGEGIMLNGPFMHAFSQLFYKYGFELGPQEIEEVNKELKERNNPPVILYYCTNYNNTEN